MSYYNIITYQSQEVFLIGSNFFLTYSLTSSTHCVNITQ